MPAPSPHFQTPFSNEDCRVEPLWWYKIQNRLWNLWTHSIRTLFCHCPLSLLLLPSRLCNWHCTVSVPPVGAQSSRHCCHLKLLCCSLGFTTCFQSFSNKAFALLFPIIHPTSQTRKSSPSFHPWQSSLFFHSSNIDYTCAVAAVRLSLSMSTQLLLCKRLLLRLPECHCLRLSHWKHGQTFQKEILLCTQSIFLHAVLARTGRVRCISCYHNVLRNNLYVLPRRHVILTGTDYFVCVTTPLLLQLPLLLQWLLLHMAEFWNCRSYCSCCCCTWCWDTLVSTRCLVSSPTVTTVAIIVVAHIVQCSLFHLSLSSYIQPLVMWLLLQHQLPKL